MEPKAVSEQLISDAASSLSPQVEVEPEKASRSTLKRLRGGFLLILGYLLSPLCWWNDLIFNLPLAYGLALVHFKILDASALLSDENLRHFSSTLPMMLGNQE